MVAIAIGLLCFALGAWCGLAHGWRSASAASVSTCRHDWLYHSLYREGQLWNRKCWRCGKHETHWPQDDPHNRPPLHAKLARGERPPVTPP